MQKLQGILQIKFFTSTLDPISGDPTQGSTSRPRDIG